MLQKGQDANVASEIGEEKDILGISVMQAKAANLVNTTLLEDEFKRALDQNSKDNNKATVESEDEEKFYVQFSRAGRVYEVDKDGNIVYLNDLDGSKKELTIVCKNSNGVELSKKVYSVYGNRYLKVSPEVEGYEAKDKKIEGIISGDNETIDVLYYYVIPETQIVFTGIDINGNKTTDPAQIVNYIIGDDSNTSGNGLLSVPTVLSTIKIPEMYNGKPVTKIGDRAFHQIRNIAIINIGNNVTTLGFYALRESGITELKLGDSVTTIGGAALWGCGNLTKLTIGSGLNSIGSSGIGGCPELKTIIYNNETNVINQIEYGCAKWTEIQINENNANFKVVDNVLYRKDGTELVKIPQGRTGSYTVPEEVTKIGDRAIYSCNQLTELNLGNRVTTLGFWALRSSGITELKLGDSVTTIGGAAVCCCSNLTKLTIGSGLNNVGGSAFQYSSALETVIIDSSTVAANLSNQNSYGYIVNYATTVYTKTTPGAYILNNFNVEASDIEGYTKYVKK